MTIPTIQTALDKATAALAADSTLAAWVLANFPADNLGVLTIWEGLDDTDPPQESNFPIVVVASVPQSYEMGTAAEQRRIPMVVAGAIQTKAIVETTPPIKRVYQGQQLIDQLANLVNTCLLTAFGGDHYQNASLTLENAGAVWTFSFAISLVYETGMNFETAIT